MPKKTKKEKIIAEYRRKLSVVSTRQETTLSGLDSPSPSAPAQSTPTFSLQPHVLKQEHQNTLTLDPQEFFAIKKDLMMTLGLTGAILVGQIMLWRIIG